MYKILLVLSFLCLTNLSAFTQEDYDVKAKCEERVYDNKNNGYDYEACQEMLSHKDAMRKYGAASSYRYWLKRLNK